MFEHLRWQTDRVLMGDLVFRLQQSSDDATWDRGADCFVFYKDKRLVDEYQRFFGARQPFKPSHILELGLWHGGSVPFWFEIFKPEKLVGLDIAKRADSEYFKRYVSARGLKDRIKTFWGVDQADTAALRRIVNGDLGGTLDMVIDDCSHLLRPTLASFNCLFPLVRPGGLYVIEDWAWEHWREFTDPMNGQEGLSRLVTAIAHATGTRTGIIRSLAVYSGFAILERGDAPLDASFKLSDHIWRRVRPAGRTTAP